MRVPRTPLPPWPAVPPSSGRVRLRHFEARDVPMAQELATDPYVPLIGSLPAMATQEEAATWVGRQGGRLAEGIGYSFVIADAGTDDALGTIGLWVAQLEIGRATAGYSVAPSARGQGVAADALTALTAFAWTLEGLDRVELHIEPWNVGSLRSAERAGYRAQGVLRRHQEIGGRRRDMALYRAVRPGPPA